jgi:hypothetical protein
MSWDEPCQNGNTPGGCTPRLTLRLWVCAWGDGQGYSQEDVGFVYYDTWTVAASVYGEGCDVMKDYARVGEFCRWKGREEKQSHRLRKCVQRRFEANIVMRMNRASTLVELLYLAVLDKSNHNQQHLQYNPAV